MHKRINEKLFELYQQVTKQFLATHSLPKNCVGPFFISCPKNYADLPTKWMYIGQETKGWLRLSRHSGVRELMCEYEKFNLAKDYRGASSPFWNFGHALDSRLNPSGPARSFIWDNTARIGYKGVAGKVSDEHLEFWSKCSLLANEVMLLSPDLILFVTGPKYDHLLEIEFPGIKLGSLSLNQPVCRLSHPALPALSFRSYHPAFLRRKHKEQQVADHVVKAVETHRARK